MLSDMRHNTLRIGEWVVDFLFAIDTYDKGLILEYLDEFEAETDVISAIEDLISSKKYNCGFTFSNSNIKRALVVTGPVSSSKQFVNTLSHEMHHLAVAIAESLGYDLDSEVPAYVAGDATMALIETICELGCPHCNQM